MKKLKFTGFHVKRYRSLMDVKIDISNNKPVVICGENNIGKTNLLRAMNLFFNHREEPDLFSASADIPHHIFYGSRGAGAKTELIGLFEKEGTKFNLRIVFNTDEDPIYYIGNDRQDTIDKIEEILSEFKFLYVESHNVNLPKLISTALEKDGLLPLDFKRKKQSEPLKKLEEFITLSQSAIADIEKEINKCFEELTDFDGILKGKKIKIKFAEFDKLRDIVKTMTEITLHDGNNHGIASKGSGAQRAVFLSLMQFISENSKQNIIWGIDEPEAFLQPKLQKKISEVFYGIVSSKQQPIILTTHSQHFVRLNELDTTHLFAGKVTQRDYVRRSGHSFYEIDTTPIQYPLGKNHAGHGWKNHRAVCMY